MMIERFNTFRQENPRWQQTYGVYQKDDPVYRRIPCVWAENTKIFHHLHATINVTTGEIYLDCRRRKIFVKNALFIVLRPLITVVKTIWHATLIGPLMVTARAIRSGEMSKKEAACYFGLSLLDSVRTPIYGLLITITHIIGFITAFLSPNTLYKTREIAGCLERKLLRVENIFDSKWARFSSCFSPIAHLLEEKDISGTLLALAKNNVTFRRRTPAIFNDGGKLLSKNKAYLSAAIHNPVLYSFFIQ